MFESVAFCVAVNAPVEGDMLPSKALLPSLLLLPMVARTQYHQEQQEAPQRHFPGGASDE